MTIAFDEDGCYKEVVDGWTVVAYQSFPHSVEVSGPERPNRRSRQDFSVDKDGDVCFDVNDSERGGGFDGDCASARYAPVKVVKAAIAAWEALWPT